MNKNDIKKINEEILHIEIGEETYYSILEHTVFTALFDEKINKDDIIITPYYILHDYRYELNFYELQIAIVKKVNWQKSIEKKTGIKSFDDIDNKIKLRYKKYYHEIESIDASKYCDIIKKYFEEIICDEELYKVLIKTFNEYNLKKLYFAIY